jgi:hypothetical protein
MRCLPSQLTAFLFTPALTELGPQLEKSA